MLKANQQELLMRIRTWLTDGPDTERTALAKQLDALLLADSAERAAVGRRSSMRGGAGQGRTPSIPFVIEIVPGSVQHVTGAVAAHEALKAALTDAGALRRLPALASFQVGMARSGNWHALVDTDNGTVAISVRRLGTNLAPSKTRAKNPKTT